MFQALPSVMLTTFTTDLLNVMFSCHAKPHFEISSKIVLLETSRLLAPSGIVETATLNKEKVLVALRGYVEAP